MYKYEWRVDFMGHIVWASKYFFFNIQHSPSSPLFCIIIIILRACVGFNKNILYFLMWDPFNPLGWVIKKRMKWKNRICVCCVSHRGVFFRSIKRFLFSLGAEVRISVVKIFNFIWGEKECPEYILEKDWTRLTILGLTILIASH